MTDTIHLLIIDQLPHSLVYPTDDPFNAFSPFKSWSRVHLHLCQTALSSAQYGGQEGHADVHAILSLTEVCSTGICVHFHTDLIDPW